MISVKSEERVIRMSEKLIQKIYVGGAVVSGAYYAYRIFKAGYGHRNGPLETAGLFGCSTIISGLASLTWPLTLPGAIVWEVTDALRMRREVAEQKRYDELNRQARMRHEMESEIERRVETEMKRRVEIAKMKRRCRRNPVAPIVVPQPPVDVIRQPVVDDSVNRDGSPINQVSEVDSDFDITHDE